MSRLRRVLRWAFLAVAGISLLGLIALGTLYYVVSSKLPDVQSLRHVELQEPLYVYSRDGRLMALFGETRRYPADIRQVPLRQKQAFIAIEDNRFYQHHGVDYKGVFRAVWLLATTHDKRVPGGSTITQQVARQFFLSSEYSYTRKLREMLLSIRMENELSKDEIFQLYLNKSFFGNRAYGIAAAAEYYYGKKLGELTLDEMATLASIPKFPSSGNPITNPERAKLRRDYVLQRMRELHFISRDEEAAAQAEPMHAAAHEPPVQVYAPYVAEMVRQEMVARFGGDVLTRGYHVTTTIDAALQAAAQQALRDGLESYDHRHGWRGAEQHFDLAADETAAAAGARVRNVAVQGGLQPAVVMGVEGSDATVAFADGSTLVLDADSSKWTGKTPAALLKRGDMVRVRPQVAQADDKAPGTPHWQLEQLPRAQSALVSLDADTGALRALIGGYSFAANKFNRATQARRQPGSSFKPFLYAAAFERGFNPASIVLDAPVVFKDRRGHIWRPQNDTGDFLGPMRLREALVQSRNLVSVRLLDAIGVDYARRYISHFGIDEALLPPNLSMSLGTASLPPLTMARGYTVFANGGFLVSPWFIDTVRDRDGRVLFKEKPAVACRACGVQLPAGAAVPTTTEVAGFDLGPAGSAAPPVSATTTTPSAPVVAPAAVPAGATLAPRAIDARVAYQLVSMMRDVVLHGTGFPARVLNREDVGGKTGSTNDHRDAWFSGFGGPYVTTVWVGRDDFQSLGYREYGGKAALPIWIDYMRVALKDQAVARNDPPDGMVKVAVGPGGRLLPESVGGITEYVKAEDLERMQAEVDLPQDDQSQQEQSFDIF